MLLICTQLEYYGTHALRIDPNRYYLIIKRYNYDIDYNGHLIDDDTII